MPPVNRNAFDGSASGGSEGIGAFFGTSRKRELGGAHIAALSECPRRRQFDTTTVAVEMASIARR
jgi:hypothetical protein